MPDPTNVNPGALAAALVVLVLAALLLMRLGKWLLPGLRKMGRFLDDWQGEPDRPGVPGRPGVMEQLSTLRDEQIATREQMTVDGTPLKEYVVKIATKQAEDSARLDTLTQVVGQSVAKSTEERVEGHRAATAAWQAVEAVAHDRDGS